jgi:thiol:disulfide interchange protein
MAWRRVAAVVAMAACSTPATPAASARITWLRSEKDALVQARADHKGVAIEFFAAYAVPSTELDKTLADPEIARVLSHDFVPLRLDISGNTDADFEVRERYHANVLPALVFVSSDGVELARVERALDRDALLAAVRIAAAAAAKPH